MAPKKSGSGCLIALGVIGGILLLFCLIGGVAMWRASQNPETKKIFTAMGKGVQMATKGINAPGTEELRKAGCRQAIVISPEDLNDMVGIFVDGGLPASAAGDEFGGPMVMCQGNAFDSLPDCDTAAAVYVKAVAPKTGFTVTVKTSGKTKDDCAQKYDASGASLGAIRKK